jgi:hypothetical protein
MWFHDKREDDFRIVKFQRKESDTFVDMPALFRRQLATMVHDLQPNHRDTSPKTCVPSCNSNIILHPWRRLRTYRNRSGPVIPKSQERQESKHTIAPAIAQTINVRDIPGENKNEEEKDKELLRVDTIASRMIPRRQQCVHDPTARSGIHRSEERFLSPSFEVTNRVSTTANYTNIRLTTQVFS